MEKIYVTVKNIVKNPKNNFLSYLYKTNGWKRIMLETSKECYIESYHLGEKIRIVVTNTGNIMIQGFCIFDILIGIEHINKELEAANITYLSLEDTDICKAFTSVIDLSKYAHEVEINDVVIETDKGTVKIEDNRANITYYKYEDGKIIRDTLKSMFEKKFDDSNEDLALEDDDGELEAELIVLSAIFAWFVCSFVGKLF